ncbi:MAG: solute-binding protein [Rhodospirillaceae bacterium]|nr:solute-binding protein [Rhodospirillales bacterium]MBT6406617.1 solute-binding protein [Rhodospirillaceae bacterium]
MPLASTSVAADKFITIASTTSTANSGLFDAILPVFEEKTGIEPRVIAVGTGQAIRQAKNGDADVLFVHHRASEDAFVSEGFGVKRFDVMYNDFLIAGPKSDPAKVHGLKDVVASMRKIAEGQKPFVSRGDDSGTHKKELGLWKKTGIDVKSQSGTWYRESGSGMGGTLNTAAGMNAYVLADRGTWLSFKNRGDLVVQIEGDPRLFNPYGVILVDPKRHPHVKAELGQMFIDWIISPEGQRLIGEFTIDGKGLFVPNAKG